MDVATLQAAVSVPVTLQLSAWELTAGPWAQWRLQRAHAPSTLHGAAAYRALPGLGGFAQLAYDVAPRWCVGLGLAFGAQFASSATRFTLQKDNGERYAVLVPDAWFGQAQLTAALRF
jgi:hypothetical protein